MKMNVDMIVFVVVLFSAIGFLYFTLTPWLEYIQKEGSSAKNEIKFFATALMMSIVVSMAIIYPFINGTNDALHSPTKYVGAEIVARGTDGAYIFEEREYGTGETYRYLSNNWLPYDAVYLLTVDKDTDEVLVVWKTADNGPRTEIAG